MFHPDSVVFLMQIEHQERIKEAARNHLATTAQRRGPSMVARLRTVSHDATVWLSERARHLTGKRGLTASQAS